MKAMSERGYRIVSAGLCAAFALVGTVFLLAPDAVLALFDGWSRRPGLPAFGGPADPFFIALAVAYMYVVTVLAWAMFRHPRDTAAARLLAQAKLASAAVSFGLCVLRQPYLVLLVNGVVDGGIGAFVLLLLRARGAAGAPEAVGAAGASAAERVG